MSTLAFTINFKGTETIEFEDIIDLTEEQILILLARGKTKSRRQWLHPDTKGVKLLLTPEQRAAVITHKTSLVEGQTAQMLIHNNIIRFSEHGLKRIAKRLDKDAFPSERALLGVAEALWLIY
jgi:hypothetical protein